MAKLITMEKENIIERNYYTQKILPYIGQPIIKILTGQRRVGKSCILKQLISYIQSTDNESLIIYINKELKEFSTLHNDDDLYQYILSKIDINKNNYVFIDEIQEIINFQNCLRSLLAEEKCDIYCTGSNATMLSGELATLLAGRYMEFHIHSLSYSEFLIFHRLSDSDESLQKYMRIGGMPYLIHFKGNEQLCVDYLQNLYSTILLKEVISKKQIRNPQFLTQLVEFISDNVGSLFSASSISKYLKSQRLQLPTQMVMDYSSALQQAYFIYKVLRSDIQGLKIFEVGEKFYFEDLGIRNAIRGFNPLADVQKWMENLVYLQLLRKGYSVYIGKNNDLEIDFLGQKLQNRVYVQVTYRLDNEQTREREIRSLLQCKDNFLKYIVTLDNFRTGITPEGIIIIHLRDFLMDKM